MRTIGSGAAGTARAWRSALSGGSGTWASWRCPMSNDGSHASIAAMLRQPS